MGKNKKEHFIFILMVCTTMVYIMSCYNVALIEGFSANIFLHAILGFPAAFVFALIVSPLIRAIFFKMFPPVVGNTESKAS